MVASHMIYALVDPRSAEVRYVGQTSRGAERTKEHIQPWSLKANAHHHSTKWLKKLLTAGLRPEVLILEECGAEDLNHVECYWIAQGRGLGWRLTNMTKGGEGARGFSPSSETREKLRAAFIGKTRSIETRAAISAALLGKKTGPRSAETCAAISAAKIGKRRSVETRLAISTALLGRVLSAAHRAAISVARSGKKLSAEHRSAMSAARLGKKRGAAFSATMRIAKLGKKLSDAHRAALSVAQKARREAERGLKS